MTVRAVGLVTHPDRREAVDLAAAVTAYLEEHGIAVRPADGRVGDGRVQNGPVQNGRVQDESAAGIPPEVVSRESGFAEGLDVVISLGGDGTMLRAVDLAYEAGVPVLGVNLGRLGYLTEVEPDELWDALERVIHGDYGVDERMVLEISVESAGPARGTWYALNEAVLEKIHTGRLVSLDVEINGAFFTRYAADGVIVATPTGSTAYSFSARGPIVSPRHRCLLLTPVSPHMLFDRALVLDADESLHFVVHDDRSVVLTADGFELGDLAGGDTVSCTGGKHPARIVTFGQRDFHQILKAKFGLSDR